MGRRPSRCPANAGTLLVIREDGAHVVRVMPERGRQDGSERQGLGPAALRLRGLGPAARRCCKGLGPACAEERGSCRG